MGLAERRATDTFQANRLSELAAEIDTLAGRPIALDIHWERLAFEGKGDRLDELWTKLFFTPVIEALRRLTRDDIGRRAVGSGVTRIVFDNSRGAYSPASAISFSDGVITIDHCDSNVDDVKDRTEHLVGLLERSL